MDASKENCERVMKIVENITKASQEDYQDLRDFLRAALKKLPSQAAIDRDRKKRKASKADV